MITPQDFNFHFKPTSHWQWAETILFPITIPEAKIYGAIYVLTRPMVGACMSDISIHSGISQVCEEMLYIDNQQHLPCPKSLEDFTLPNGLSVKVIEPLKHFRVTYEGIDDTRFDIEYFGLHAPFDINDPRMDPSAAKRVDPAWDSSWSGHYDATYRMKGELTLRGKRYKVDSVDTGDRSWGPRPEGGNTTMIWWNGSFGEVLTAHVITTHDIARTDDFGPLVSGYVLEDGQLYGVKEARGAQRYYRGTLPIGGELEVIDTRNKRFFFTYSVLNSSFWSPMPSNTYSMALMQINNNGQIGYGGQQMVMSRAYLTKHRSQIAARI